MIIKVPVIVGLEGITPPPEGDVKCLIVGTSFSRTPLLTNIKQLEPQWEWRRVLIRRKERL